MRQSVRGPSGDDRTVESCIQLAGAGSLRRERVGAGGQSTR